MHTLWTVIPFDRQPSTMLSTSIRLSSGAAVHDTSFCRNAEALFALATAVEQEWNKQ